MSREWAKNAFTYTFSPSSFRTNIFQTSVSELQDHIHPSLAECIGPIDEFRMQLVDAYRDNRIYEGRPDPAVYATLYPSIMESIALIAQCMENAQDVSLCPSLLHLYTVTGKRPHKSRDSSKDEAEYQQSSEGTEEAEKPVALRKKQKKVKHQWTEKNVPGPRARSRTCGSPLANPWLTFLEMVSPRAYRIRFDAPAMTYIIIMLDRSLTTNEDQMYHCLVTEYRGAVPFVIVLDRYEITARQWMVRMLGRTSDRAFKKEERKTEGNL